MALPQKIPILTSPAIASYNYTDIAEGTGVTSFNGAAITDSTGTTQLLTTAQIYSNPIELSASSYTQTASTKQIDKDFDLSSFNFPKDIKGTAFLNFAAHSQGGANHTHFFIAKIRKWNGTTESEIASAQSETRSNASEKPIAMKITVPLTHFKKGETLRLTIEGWAAMDSGTGHLVFAADPQGRDGSFVTAALNDTTSLTFKCPFVIKV